MVKINFRFWFFLGNILNPSPFFSSMVKKGSILVFCLGLFLPYSNALSNPLLMGALRDSSLIKKNYLKKKDFHKLLKGKMSQLFIIKNAVGMQAAITNYGARLVGLWVKDQNKMWVDVVVGNGSVEGFQASAGSFYGATIGRYANRIAQGKFILDGHTYSLPINNAPNSLHGGGNGFHNQVWDLESKTDSSLQLRYFSKDMEEGFPGNMKIKVTYTLTSSNKLKIEYEATTDKKTVINLTNHAYFNLNGMGSGTILNHSLKLISEYYTPVNVHLIPTGKLDPVAGTPFDFNQFTTLGSRIEEKNTQLDYGKGYDHNFVLKSPSLEIPVAIVRGEKSSIEMEVFTDQPGIQFYSGNFMSSKNTLKGGYKDGFRTGFALETQHFPDSPNQPEFPTTVLNPGDIYKTTTLYGFNVIAGSH